MIPTKPVHDFGYWRKQAALECLEANPGAPFAICSDVETSQENIFVTVAVPNIPEVFEVVIDRNNTPAMFLLEVLRLTLKQDQNKPTGSVH